MYRVFTYNGGYALNEAKKTEAEPDVQEALENGDLEPVLCRLIDNNEIVYLNADLASDEEKNDEDTWTYIDNTSSDVRPGCYYVETLCLHIEEPID